MSAEPELEGLLVEELQRSGTHADDSLERLQVGVECPLDLLERDAAVLPADPQLHRQLAHGLEEADEDAREKPGLAGREGALGDTLADDPLEQRPLSARRQASQLLPDDRVVVREPDAHDPEDEVLAFGLVLGDPAEHGFELPGRRESGIVEERLDPRHRLVGHALDDRVVERVLGFEVVVEGAPRGSGRVQDVLEAETFVAAGLDEALGGIDEDVPPDGVSGRVEGPGHGSPILRPTVGLIIAPGVNALGSWIDESAAAGPQGILKPGIRPTYEADRSTIAHSRILSASYAPGMAAPRTSPPRGAVVLRHYATRMNDDGVASPADRAVKFIRPLYRTSKLIRATNEGGGRATPESGPGCAHSPRAGR